MSIPSKYKGKYFFHFTHAENLDSVIKNGLLSKNKLLQLGITNLDVSEASIQARRSEMDVTCGPGGKVHDYVPFYFGVTNPMFLSLIKSKNFDQPFFIFLAISVEKLLNSSVVFTDASANSLIPPHFYSSPEDLDKLDWEAINSRKWKSKDDEEKHRRMAEVLIRDEVPVSWIDKIVVWNESVKTEVQRLFSENNVQSPEVVFQPLDGKYFFLTKFFIPERKNESLVTGPYILKRDYFNAVKNIKNKREEAEIDQEFPFEDLEDALSAIDEDFASIKELEDIFELETENPQHSENVSDHTISVVQNLTDSDYYKECNLEDQNILKFSAYLHDIGKGPKSKWKNGKQMTYPDHPADAPEMLERILTEDIEFLSDCEIESICLLVTYHDLIGEILERGRNQQQLVDIIEDEKQFDMLSALNYADVSAINTMWAFNYRLQITKFKKDIMKLVSEK